MMDINKLAEFLDDVTEEDGITIVSHVMRKFGWAGTFYTRQDAESFNNDPITDHEWEALKFSYEWRKLGEILSEHAWEIIGDGLESVRKERDASSSD